MKAPSLSRSALWCLPLLSGASALILAAAPAQYLGRQQDDLLYLIASQSLACGRGLRLLTSPGTPAMTMINPVFPLLLAPITRLFGERFGVHQAFCALILAAVPWACWLWLRKRLGDLPAGLVGACFAASPIVLSQAGAVMSEPLFTLLTIALLADLERAPVTSARAGAGGGLLLLLTQTRLAGLPLLGACAAEPAARGRWKQSALIAAPAAAGVLAWTLWSRATTGSLSKVDELALSYGASFWGRLPPVAAENAREYLTSLGSCLLPIRLGGGTLGLALGLSWLALAGFGAALVWKRRAWHPAVLALALTAAMHLAWPWHYERYLIMPLPLILWLAAEGLSRRAVPALAAILATQLGFQARPWLSGTSWRQPELPRAYAWLRGALKPGETISSAMFVRDGFYAGAPSAPLVDAPDATALAETMKRRGVRYVLMQDGLDVGLSLSPTAAIAGQLSRIGKELRNGRYFELAYQDDGESTRIYRLK